MSYKEIKSFIEDFAGAHEMVAEFQAENMDGVAITDTTNYPLVFSNPLGSNKNTAGYSYKLQLYILDYSTDDLYVSKEYCVQKCHKIAHDLENYLSKYKKRIPISYTINSEFNFSRDKVHGVSVDFDLIGGGGCLKNIKNIINGS
jgi:transposase